jgi:peptide/nickel transport system permease protein
MTTPPPTVTGFILIDSIISGNWAALWDGILHLVLPVTALTFCMTGQIMKMTRSSMSDILKSDFISYAKMMGLPKKVIRKYAVRNALPPVVTMIGYVYGFLLGGAVLIETVFSWGGLGQYVTQAIAFKDYAAVQGFMIVATIFSMFVYLIVDIVYMIIDPRIRF